MPKKNGKQMQPIIKIDKVTKRFDKKVVLNEISLNIYETEIFGLLGPSGAGKTTLVRMIVGIDTADHGEIHVLNQKMPNLSMLQKIGFMAQSEALYTELTAYENLDFFASLFGMKGAARKRRMEEVLSLVNLEEDLHKKVVNYSGGMKRRLSLAIALLHSPKILILDEPTVGIDPLLRQSIWRELKRLSHQGTTIVVTTHVMDEAYKCDHLGMIRDGHIIAEGSAESLTEQTGTSTIEEAFLYFGGVKS